MSYSTFDFQTPWYKKKHPYFLGALSLVTLALFAKNPSTPTTPEPAKQAIVTPIKSPNLLTVAAPPEHLFMYDGHIHGLTYDVINRYADHHGIALEVHAYRTQADAIQALENGKADIVLSYDSYHPEHLASMRIDCKTGTAIANTDGNASFVMHKDNTKLLTQTKNYLCTPEAINNTKTIAEFYKTNAIDAYSMRHFERAIKERLPMYQNSFKAAAQKYNHDWQLLVAISYQESHLDPSATSRTGVQGLMMLTNDTATTMGVSDRTDVIESIQGGAKYLELMENRFDDIPETERLWFMLAAYNMGPNAVRNIQSEIKKSGKNPNLWSNFYAYLSNNAEDNGRYVQCMHYVTNIRTYYELLKDEKALA